ncbi:quinone-dependent dihydroorotate dehydrogenase [Patescibacteria group bacterium]|nr:MAG: quinone-dependent dihydroorotate dehydrogenase [Patescibacteria group bacterium]
MAGEFVTARRNRLLSFFYRRLFKPIFFRLDPERVHDRLTAAGVFLGRRAPARELARLLFDYRHPSLTQTIKGITFPNPVGLSAGFDKNAWLTGIIPAVGFGFMEVGSITGRPCEGNPKPRLWRLKKSEALVVYYGLKNEGAAAIEKRLRGKKFVFPVGVSIAKANCPETAETAAGIQDYFEAYRTLAAVGDYVTVNISCPNAFGGQPFTDRARLAALLARLNTIPKTKPIFVKLSPDLEPATVETIVEVSLAAQVDGFVCTNLTKKRDNPKILDAQVPEQGGLSGKIVADLSDQMIKRVYRLTGGRAVIIGTGGVFTAADAYRKIRAGASLIQLITGMIFRGPQTASEINLGLVKLLTRDGFKNIGEAVGRDN